MWEKAEVMRISREPSPAQIMVDEKQLENVKYFKYLSFPITNDLKAHSTGRRRPFHQQIGLKFKEKTSELLHLEHRKLWC